MCFFFHAYVGFKTGHDDDLREFLLKSGGEHVLILEAYV